MNLKKVFIVCIITIFFIDCKLDQTGINSEYYENSHEYSNYSIYSSDYTQHPNHGRYQKVVEKMVETGNPGVALLVTDEYGTWAGSTGFVDLQTRVPWSPNSISRIGSVSKVFCSALLLKLQEDGVLDLDTPIDEILSSKTLSGIANRGSTVRQLLNHTSGIPDYLDMLNFNSTFDSPIYSTQNPLTPKKCLDYIRDKKADFPIGEGYRYSNSNFILAEYVIEAVTGKQSHDLLKELIIDPLELPSTYYDPANPLPKGLARGYIDDFGNGMLRDLTDHDWGVCGLDGGIISNIFDLNTFIRILLTDRNFLSQESLDQMKQIPQLPDGVGEIYGLGLMDPTEGSGFWGHGGLNFSYSSLMFYNEDNGNSYTLLTNIGSNQTQIVMVELIDMLKN